MSSNIPKLSALPKSISGLKKPTIIQKDIIPTDRLKPSSSTGIRPGGIQNRMPLAHDIANIIGRRSPDIPKITSRAKLRRSKSVGDIREAFKRPIFKRTQPVLAPIPAKAAKILNNLEKTNFANKNEKVNNTAAKPSGTETKNPVTNNVRKKIPPYDYKARFLDLQERHKTLKEKYNEAKEQLVNLEQFEECQGELIKVKEDLKNANTQLDCLRKQNNSQSTKINSLSKNLADTKDELNDLREKYEQVTKDLAKTLNELNELKEKTSELVERNIFLTTELDECKEQLFKANIERKDLHNAVLDLRGNIRVFCRVRPPLQSEEDRLLCGWNYIDESSLEIHSLEAGNKKGAVHAFTFDQVFHPRSTQEDIFEMVSPLIQSAFDGYNICIFAYGQTGSGKTFTMDGVEENIGVIPRAVGLIFESLKNYKRLGWEYKIKASFLEIYNENLYDLLSNEQKDMEIRMAKNKTDIYVSNITEVDVNTANELRELIHIAKLNRATAATASNERSSRSHAVTRIELFGEHEEKSEVSIGMINLVDLAGSESPKTSIRMNETKNINRSLSELTNVILALLQKQDHVPYRNSKLTHLLMPSLGGNSKTLMFINVSPFQDCFVESVKSLRFAASVNSCKLTKVRKNKFLNISNSSNSSAINGNFL